MWLEFNMKKRYLNIICFLIFAGLTSPLYSQDLESIGKEGGINVSGGISTNQIYYSAFSEGAANRDPYSYFLSGNLNFDIYGWSIPLTYTYSNQNSSFQQPFNQYCMHPRYKWITAHIGYASMSFSPYTLSGHLFVGAGLDLSPSDKIKIQVMYGQLNKAVNYDTIASNNMPAYKRMGFGLKTSYKYKTGYVDVIMFKSKDEPNSVDSIPLTTEILPEENLVLSLKTGTSIIKNLNFNIEYAVSAFSRDIRVDKSTSDAGNIFDFTNFIYTQRQSSSYYNAMNTNLNYSFKLISIGVKYERIDPEYQTHGAYYFNNDMENISLTGSASLLKQKIRLNANIGIQKDDLNNDKISSMNRMVSSYSLGYNASEKFSLNLSYSTYQSYTNIKSQFDQINALTQYDNLDTLNFTQISETMNGNFNYQVSRSEDKRQQLNFNLSYQQASDQQGGQEVNAGPKFFNVNTAYNYTRMPVNLSVTAAINYNQSMNADLNTMMLGPTLSVNKTFFDKLLNSTLSVSMNNAYTNDKLTSQVFNVRINNSIKYQKKHMINLSLVYVDRDNKTAEIGGLYSEFTATLGYNYSFR